MGTMRNVLIAIYEGHLRFPGAHLQPVHSQINVACGRGQAFRGSVTFGYMSVMRCSSYGLDDSSGDSPGPQQAVPEFWEPSLAK